MSQRTKWLAVLFADITGSTQLYESIGDMEARRLCGACIDRVSQITAENHGTVVKTMGDGLMAVFDTADDAIQAAIRMQEEYSDQPISISIGFHFGQVIEDHGDVFGDTVNVAARLADIAKSGEILLAQETVKQLSPPFQASTQYLDTTTVKGRTEKVDIYTVTGFDDEQTMNLAASQVAKISSQQNFLLVTFGTQGHILDAQPGAAFVIGRTRDCDLCVPGTAVSRRHAVITRQRDLFVLTDQSVNGTWIAASDGSDAVFLKRESYQLLGKGIVSLGTAPSDTDGPFVRFEHRFRKPESQPADDEGTAEDRDMNGN